jgi:hypothetical protein
MAVLLAACGGSATPDVEDSGDTDDQTTATTTTAVDDDDDTDTSTNTGLPGECVSLGMALSRAAGLGMVGQGGDPGDTADSLMALAGAAPGEIADDFEVMAAAFAEFAQTLADAGVDSVTPPPCRQPTGRQPSLLPAKLSRRPRCRKPLRT